MKPDGIERKVIDKLSENLVMRKSEMLQALKVIRADTTGFETVMKSLIARGLVTEVYASEKTYAITQRGMKEFV